MKRIVIIVSLFFLNVCLYGMQRQNSNFDLHSALDEPSTNRKNQIYKKIVMYELALQRRDAVVVKFLCEDRSCGSEKDFDSAQDDIARSK